MPWVIPHQPMQSIPAACTPDTSSNRPCGASAHAAANGSSSASEAAASHLNVLTGSYAPHPAGDLQAPSWVRGTGAVNGAR